MVEAEHNEVLYLKRRIAELEAQIEHNPRHCQTRIAELEAEQKELIHERQSADNAAKGWLKVYQDAKRRTAELEDENSKLRARWDGLEVENAELRQRWADMCAGMRKVELLGKG